MEHTFWKDGDVVAVGGFFVRNELKKFFNALIEKGLNPVGLKVDDESFNLEVIVERNQAYIDMYENDKTVAAKNHMDTGVNPAKEHDPS